MAGRRHHAHSQQGARRFAYVGQCAGAAARRARRGQHCGRRGGCATRIRRPGVLFNNAGYALAGAFQAITPAQVQKQFNTYVYGVMNVTRAVLPQFREQKQGLILTTTSVGGHIAFPLYNATKFAFEDFMESAQPINQGKSRRGCSVLAPCGPRCRACFGLHDRSLLENLLRNPTT
ncbi:SDR family NAD(P)-dependent oxidoreductase [Hymenobacter ginkgonis]|uniref:SDR family NAD(P)-dependent oxidoreductase n=1 Tax=Hymenobacter ginkgonis TaxID=2682976 RepID=UPI0021CF091F